MSETWCPKCQHYHEITTAGGCLDREDLLSVGAYAEGFRDGQEAERRRAAPRVVEEPRDVAINAALDRIAVLTDSGNYHGYRSEVWCAIAAVYDAALRAVGEKGADK